MQGLGGEANVLKRCRRRVFLACYGGRGEVGPAYGWSVVGYAGRWGGGAYGGALG